MTGSLNRTFYASATAQLQTLLGLSARVDPAFVARTAVYCRERGCMKDTPALLCAVLAARGPKWLERVFERVIDSPRMLRTFVQIVRSGVTGRKSFGSFPRRLVRRWLAVRSDDTLFRSSVGTRPSLGDIIALVHPKRATPQRAALYGYLRGRRPAADSLPALVQQYERFKATGSGPPPDVPFELLAGLPLSSAAWVEIARRVSWQTVRMNLNTFA